MIDAGRWGATATFCISASAQSSYDVTLEGQIARIVQFFHSVSVAFVMGLMSEPVILQHILLDVSFRVTYALIVSHLLFCDHL
jgi:hypothetical protein